MTMVKLNKCRILNGNKLSISVTLYRLPQITSTFQLLTLERLLKTVAHLLPVSTHSHTHTFLGKYVRFYHAILKQKVLQKRDSILKCIVRNDSINSSFPPSLKQNNKKVTFIKSQFNEHKQKSTQIKRIDKVSLS